MSWKKKKTFYMTRFDLLLVLMLVLVSVMLLSLMVVVVLDRRKEKKPTAPAETSRRSENVNSVAQRGWTR